MKKFILIFAVIVSAMSAKAQDTIFTKSGNTINAKVMEITQTEVKYKKTANPEGPLYTAERSDIMFIQYKNGSKDVFTNGAVNGASGNTNGQAQTTTNNYYQNQNPRPGVNVVVAPPFYGPGYGYGYGWRRSYYYRPYYGGGYYHHHHGWH